MNKPYGFVYETTNNINGKRYIGQRRMSHDWEDDAYLGSGTILTKALKKYGKQNFSKTILDYAYSQKELDEKEKHYILINNATDSQHYYNIHVGGTGGHTTKGWSEERKLKHKQLMSDISTGEKNGMYGKKHTKDTCSRISQVRLENISNGKYDNTIKSDSFKLKMSEVTKGEKNGMYGRKHTEQSKKKMSENRKGLNKGENNGNYGNKGDLAKNGKPVYAYEDESHTKLAKSFNTVRLFLEEYNLKGHVGLMKAIQENKQYKGYYWSRTLNV